jgi:hypothetical protein
VLLCCRGQSLTDSTGWARGPLTHRFEPGTRFADLEPVPLTLGLNLFLYIKPDILYIEGMKVKARREKAGNNGEISREPGKIPLAGAKR